MMMDFTSLQSRNVDNVENCCNYLVTDLIINFQHFQECTDQNQWGYLLTAVELFSYFCIFRPMFLLLMYRKLQKKCCSLQIFTSWFFYKKSFFYPYFLQQKSAEFKNGLSMCVCSNRFQVISGLFIKIRYKTSLNLV